MLMMDVSVTAKEFAVPAPHVISISHDDTR